jgi:hypothetical protein
MDKQVADQLETVDPNATGVYEEHLTVEIPTEIQAGLAPVEIVLPPCAYTAG